LGPSLTDIEVLLSVADNLVERSLLGGHLKDLALFLWGVRREQEAVAIATFNATPEEMDAAAVWRATDPDAPLVIATLQKLIYLGIEDPEGYLSGNSPTGTL
jgi:hypothetical protein